MLVYSLIPEAEVVAVADTIPMRAEALAKKFGVRRAFLSHHDLLESGRLDLVDICTPTSTHSMIAQDAARVGCHVLVEKPMARTSKECVEMADAARRSGVNISVCHNKLFHPVVESLRRIAQDHGLVALRTFSRSPASQRRAEWIATPDEGGFLWEQGCHASYVHNSFLGEISEVHVLAGKVSAPIDNLFLVLVRSREGLIGQMDFSSGLNQNASRIEMETAGGDGFVADLSSNHIERRTIPPGGYIRRNLWMLASELNMAFERRVAYSLRLALQGPKFAHRSHYLLIERMLKSIRNPEVPPPVTAEDGLAAVILLERIESALADGRDE